jgi:flagellar biosynthesis protein FliP
MRPVLERSWNEGVKPLMNNEIDEETSFTRSVEPIQDFMLKPQGKKIWPFSWNWPKSKRRPKMKPKKSRSAKPTAPLRL